MGLLSAEEANLSVHPESTCIYDFVKLVLHGAVKPKKLHCGLIPIAAFCTWITFSQLSLAKQDFPIRVSLSLIFGFDSWHLVSECHCFCLVLDLIRKYCLSLHPVFGDIGVVECKEVNDFDMASHWHPTHKQLQTTF